MDWYPTLATFAGIQVPNDRVIDGRDISPLLRGETKFVPAPAMKLSINAAVPLRRSWDPPAEWDSIVARNEYNDAFFYHGSQGALAAVRWRRWKLYLNPMLTLYDLQTDPGETKPVRNGEVIRKLRGMAVLFQQEMQSHSRPAGEVFLANSTDKTNLSPKSLSTLSSKRNVTYARYGDRALEMDIYRPKELWGELPAIICIHGGGWAKGDRTSHTKMAQALAMQGFVTATISYRLSGEAPFPAAIHDCKAAVRYLRSHATDLGIDADHIGAIGLSAGGHLAALLATSGGVETLEGTGGNKQFSSKIQAAVPMGAQTDLLSERVTRISEMETRGQIWRQFLTGTQAQQPELYRLASPLEHLDASDPPCLFITGGEDDPSTRAKPFRTATQAWDVPAEVIVIDGAPHAFINRQDWFDEMIESANDFFRRTLK